MHCIRKLEAGWPGNTTSCVHHAWPILFSPLIVFTATISLSVFLRMDLVRRALYTMPNSPVMNALVNCCFETVNVLYLLVYWKSPSTGTSMRQTVMYGYTRDIQVKGSQWMCFTKENSGCILWFKCKQVRC